MSAINGVSLGVVTAYAILDSATGELHQIKDIVDGSGSGGEVSVENITDATTVGKGILKAADADAVKTLIDVQDGAAGPQGPQGPAGTAGATGAAGVGINSISAARVDNTVTLTFTMSDTTTKTASFDLPTA